MHFHARVLRIVSENFSPTGTSVFRLCGSLPFGYTRYLSCIPFTEKLILNVILQTSYCYFVGRGDIESLARACGKSIV